MPADVPLGDQQAKTDIRQAGKKRLHVHGQLLYLDGLGARGQRGDGIGQFHPYGFGLGEAAAQVGIAAVTGGKRHCPGRDAETVAHGVVLIHYPGGCRSRAHLVAQRTVEIQHLAAAGLPQPLAQHPRVIGGQVAALGSTIIAAPTLGCTGVLQPGGLRRRLKAQGGFGVAGPLNHGGDGRTIRDGVHGDDLEPGVANDGVALVADPVAMFAGGGGHGRGLQGGDRVLGGESQLVRQQGEPLAVDAEGRVGPVVVVSGGNQHWGRLPVSGQAAADTFGDGLDVATEEGVGIGHGQDGLLLASRQGQHAYPQVIVNPGGVGVAVAHVHLALVPGGNEYPGVIRVHALRRQPARRVRQVVAAAVDGGQHAATGGAGLQLRCHRRHLGGGVGAVVVTGLQQQGCQCYRDSGIQPHGFTPVLILGRHVSK